MQRLEGVGLKVIVLHSRSHQDVQRSLQLHIAVDRHARDPLGPFLVLVRVAAGFVAEEKYPARLQHTEDLAEALRQIRPEINGLKGRDSVEPRGRKDHLSPNSAI